ncbi:MAG: LacI family transcriptional regulator [Ilumatobacteraceae bacterium]|nr:LacI family transcriptional regulator [Ilumatobacteraceae bacterium]
MSPRRVTLVDVAQRASVSVATVSRALSGDPQISAATQVRVRQIADDLKYVPNVTARALVLQSSATFGLMTPDVTDPIHGQVVTGFQQRAAEHGYSVILSNNFGDAGAERRALREFAAHRVAGVTVMGNVLPQAEVKRLLSPSPVLFIGSDHVPTGGGELDLPRGCLRPDDRDGMRQVVHHLIEQGYRKVAYVSGSTGANKMIRRDALVSALAERGRAAPVIHEADDIDAGDLQAVAAKIGRSRPDAVVCYDDKTALLLMDELRTAGVRIPDDVGIVGFDDIPFARISNPRLTSVSQRSDELGRISVDFLLSTVETGKLPGSQLMPVALVVRETTPGPAPRAQRNDK